ncbi:FYVE and RUN domain containing protein [Trichuris trichiura]|uniref:FYVE and RUN domain containing protein n=1 Tax=Trichuris trichiura TaxID=36087 RepID=A0A077Z329_TRITR|nr:FYVE and RUN domain containing protein [Trichuris trichiura]
MAAELQQAMRITTRGQAKNGQMNMSTLNFGGCSFQDTRAVQRNNLFLLSRLAIRSLLEKAMSTEDRCIGAEDAQLINFFVTFEKAIRHGSRNTAVWKQEAQDIWQMLHRVAAGSKELREAVSCIDQLPHVHSYVGRLRAWLRLSIIQKKLADYVLLLIESKSITDIYYEEWALLRHDSTAVPFAGSLLGLRALNCELFLKEDDLMGQPADVDLSIMIKLPSLSAEQMNDALSDFDRTDAHVKSLMDQGSYLEERNSQLQAQKEALLRRLEALEERLRNGKQEPEKEAPFPTASSKSDELEVAMTLLEQDVHQKQDAICSLREQLDDIKRINMDLYRQLRLLEGVSREKDLSLSQIKTEKAVNETRLNEQIEESKARIDQLEEELKSNRDSLHTFETELERSSALCRELQTLLQQEQSSKRELQSMLEALRKDNEMLKERANMLSSAEQNNRELRAKCSTMVGQIAEYEKALEEVGVHLSQSKLKVEDLKEGLLPFVDARWTDDKDVTDCQGCQQKFSVSRRKHHCRHCGGIFCHQCSENTLPLPSSAKPVRVCDSCFSLLLERLTAKGGPSPSSSDMAGK